MKIAVAQISTGRDVNANLELVRASVADAASRGAQLVVFPEATMRAFGHNLTDIAEPLDGPFAKQVRSIAARHNVTLVVGMFTPGGKGHVRNTLLVTGAGVEGHYDKIHLFDAFGFTESDTVTPGNERLVLDIAGTRVGFATCYDVRFPQLFIDNAREGAEVNVICASWGSGVGKVEQWRLLTRARALDSTSFVVACGQADPQAACVEAVPGAPTGVGYSAVIAPDGRVLAEASAAPELLLVDTNEAAGVGVVNTVRESIPVLRNARLS